MRASIQWPCTLECQSKQPEKRRVILLWRCDERRVGKDHTCFVWKMLVDAPERQARKMRGTFAGQRKGVLRGSVMQRLRVTADSHEESSQPSYDPDHEMVLLFYASGWCRCTLRFQCVER